MTTCPSCAAENPAGKRFCGECGARLGETPAAQAPREERRVVTILFSDLAAFTSRSETLDPEDARALLVPYYAILEAEITSHGGVVERHIGDGIMAIFGAPVAHEDDPERAIRAALRILERVPALGTDLHARIGINTGEILYRSEGAGREDAVTGDAANTAARLQGLAPVDGVVVGEATWRATSRVFEYVEHEPATVKGKAEPIRVFQPTAARARFGVDVADDLDTPFVGRDIDFTLLKGLFAKSVASDAVQLVTIVGEPGIGKSRLVAELSRHAEELPDLVTWRQGRCLPYGRGITFWALGEIVKAQAGILDSDPPEVASEKLAATLPEGHEQPWFLQRLLPLVGIEASSSAAQEELFTAWRRYLEHLAEGRPTVLVFEDLHWADDAMLAFLEHLADRAEGVPLLVVGTSRPELYGRHPTFGAGLPNANRINLAPLTAEDTGRLVSALLQTDVIPPELRAPVLDRASGNPLYAEEFVRLLKDRGLVVKGADGWSLLAGSEIPLPDSVHALIAARLDTLTPDVKSLLADAAVVGKVFWAGAVAAMGGRDPEAVVEALRDLSRKELVRAARRSTMENEAEYAFWHVLARDVAYGQLARSDRAARHLAAARWIEAKAGDRVEDLADVLAYHHSTALEMARSSGQHELATELQGSALRFLLLAGERALGLDTAAALGSFERALAVVPIGDERRPHVLVRYGEALQHSGMYQEAAAALSSALEDLRAGDDVIATIRGLLRYADLLITLGDANAIALREEALALGERHGPSPAVLAALTDVAGARGIQGRSHESLALVERGIALAAELGLDVPARLIGIQAMARTDLGDPGGLPDFRRALELAERAGLGREVGLQYNNLAIALLGFEGPAAALRVVDEGLSNARARGLVETVSILENSAMDMLVNHGEHDVVLRMAAEIEPRLVASGDVFDLTTLRSARVRVAALRGTAGDLEPEIEWLETAVRATGDPQFVALGLGSAAMAQRSLGRLERAVALVSDVEAFPDSRSNVNYSFMLPALVRIALAAGDADLAGRLMEHGPPYLYAEHARAAALAAVMEASGAWPDAAAAYADVARRWTEFGDIPEIALALLGQGRCLIRASRRDAGRRVLEEARAIFERLQARPALSEIDALLLDGSPASPAAT